MASSLSFRNMGNRAGSKGLRCVSVRPLRFGRTGGLSAKHLLTFASGEKVSAMKIDSHLHVWANEEESQQFPYERTPMVQGNTDHLTELMAASHVEKAMIVQSATHGFDHSYVKEAMRRFPDMFLGCLLANPDNNGRGVEDMAKLVKEDGFRCVRFNPYIWPNGHRMTNETGRALFKKAGELNVPVGFMLFNGLLQHVEEIEALCLEYPKTLVILDHFGFSKNTEDAWKKLLEWAKYPQIYVKASAFFRNSKEAFPYLDLRTNFRKVVDGYGANRLLWGTDYPFVTQECGYDNAWKIIEEGDRATGEKLLTEEEKEWIMGRTFQNLFLS